MEENEPAHASAKAVAAALNSALQTSANPQQTLDAFVQSLGHIRGHPVPARRAEHRRAFAARGANAAGTGARAGSSICSAMPEIGAAFPVTIEGKRVGDIVFAPDLSADLYEKWIGFLAIACSGIALMLLTGIIAYFTAGSALAAPAKSGRWPHADANGRLRTPDPGVRTAGDPQEFARKPTSSPARSARLSQDNRGLLRRIVSLQDDERRDMARELHDELGPLLFGIRANTVALLEAIPPDKAELGSAAEGILQSVEALQQANRRILDRLRPLYIQELGLESSIQTLLQNAQAQAPDLKLTSQIDARLNAVDGLLSQTIYRVIQEAVTNVLRHARADAMHVGPRSRTANWSSRFPTTASAFRPTACSAGD